MDANGRRAPCVTRARASRFAAATSTRSPISDHPNARSSLRRSRETNTRTNKLNERHAGSDLRAHRAGWDPNGELVLGTVLSRTRDSTGVRVFLMRVIRRARAVSIVRLGGGGERARERDSTRMIAIRLNAGTDETHLCDVDAQWTNASGSG